ncbi:serine/threonine-protein kinase PLK1-like [Ptychodera flava]|uniref:serine/threonine-protein kinase PLK1-like n=1 Tax=Ptychodera flava TaxID=63121 RepID=UPI00396A31B3
MSSRHRPDDPRLKEIPDIVVDPTNNKRYMKGRFLGKGGFAKCYEMTDVDTQQIFACKIVPKALLVKPHQKDKMTMEIAIHRSLNHPHVVGFHGFFEDKDFVFVLLELCRRRSLMELHKRRKAVTEPETRYFMRQILLATVYIHKQKVIHRDLKLGNLFLNDQMDIKIGDFGLATRVDYDGERKKTLCGTPNYIAPEVLYKKGHSYEVDTWSIGCILYTLLVGKPPFETTCLKDTYARIKKNEYYIPSRISPQARFLIQKLLRSDPSERPTIQGILDDEFFKCGPLPSRLPTSCLTTAPRFSIAAPVSSVRKPLLEKNGKEDTVSSNGFKKETEALRKIANTQGKQEENCKTDGGRGILPSEEGGEPSDCYLSDLLSQLNSVNGSNPSAKPNIDQDEAEDPAAVPVYWVSKWVDYSDKYGLGYMLSDDSVGVRYNDNTKLLLYSNGETLQYIEKDGTESFYKLKDFPEHLTKKMTLLKYFRNYMNENLSKAGAQMTPRDGDDMIRLPFLNAWFRTRSAIVIHLSNGTLQVNFFQDHTKIIICPLMSAVTYIDEKKNFRTYRLPLIEKHGCCKVLSNRLDYARAMVERLIVAKSGSGRTKST